MKETYTAAEREELLRQMRELTSLFYRHVTRIGVHPMIEFTGLMNEYIACCQDAHDRGIDFTQCNTHTGQVLPVASYRLAYINEKLDCIFTGLKAMDHQENAHGKTA